MLQKLLIIIKKNWFLFVLIFLFILTSNYFLNVGVQGNSVTISINSKSDIKNVTIILYEPSNKKGLIFSENADTYVESLTLNILKGKTLIRHYVTKECNQGDHKIEITSDPKIEISVNGIKSSTFDLAKSKNISVDILDSKLDSGIVVPLKPSAVNFSFEFQESKRNNDVEPSLYSSYERTLPFPLPLKKVPIAKTDLADIKMDVISSKEVELNAQFKNYEPINDKIYFDAYDNNKVQRKYKIYKKRANVILKVEASSEQSCPKDLKLLIGDLELENRNGSCQFYAENIEYNEKAYPVRFFSETHQIKNEEFANELKINDDTMGNNKTYIGTIKIVPRSVYLHLQIIEEHDEEISNFLLQDIKLFKNNNIIESNVYEIHENNKLIKIPIALNRQEKVEFELAVEKVGYEKVIEKIVLSENSFSEPKVQMIRLVPKDIELSITAKPHTKIEIKKSNQTIKTLETDKNGQYLAPIYLKPGKYVAVADCWQYEIKKEDIDLVIGSKKQDIKIEQKQIPLPKSRFEKFSDWDEKRKPLNWIVKDEGRKLIVPPGDMVGYLLGENDSLEPYKNYWYRNSKVTFNLHLSNTKDLGKLAGFLIHVKNSANYYLMELNQNKDNTCIKFYVVKDGKQMDLPPRELRLLPKKLKIEMRIKSYEVYLKIINISNSNEIKVIYDNSGDTPRNGKDIWILEDNAKEKSLSDEGSFGFKAADKEFVITDLIIEEIKEIKEIKESSSN